MCKHWKVNGAKRKQRKASDLRADELWQASRTEATYTFPTSYLL